MTTTAASSLRGAATVFAVHDVRRSVEHYRDALGFRIVFTLGEPMFYAGVERDNVLIYLQAASETKRQPGQGSVYVFVTGVDALYDELAARGAHTLQPPRDYSYGMRDFNVADVDGNELCFGTESSAQPAT